MRSFVGYREGLWCSAWRTQRAMRGNPMILRSMATNQRGIFLEISLCLSAYLTQRSLSSQKPCESHQIRQIFWERSRPETGPEGAFAGIWMTMPHSIEHGRFSDNFSPGGGWLTVDDPVYTQDGMLCFTGACRALIIAALRLVQGNSPRRPHALWHSFPCRRRTRRDNNNRTQSRVPGTAPGTPLAQNYIDARKTPLRRRMHERTLHLGHAPAPGCTGRSCP
jgi:hypothetical protein